MQVKGKKEKFAKRRSLQINGSLEGAKRTEKIKSNCKIMKSKALWQTYPVVWHFYIFWRNKKYVLRLQVSVDETHIMYDCRVF